ncbi:MAG: OsmC family protein [Theionarchaea archaeon]|nr:OsmC family protein [Theionarchaea archaeon]
MQYKNRVIWESEKKGTLKIEGKPDLKIATPPEFGGHKGIHSPEDLFVASLNACTLSTFLSFAERTRTKFISFECSAEGTLEKKEGQLQFTRIVLTPRVEVPSEREKNHALHALALVDKYCLVTHSVSCDVEMNPEVTVVS